jgi:hypothetical protein
MLSELSDLLAVVPEGSRRDVYEAAVVEDNILGKPTAATRRLTFQRLAELYGLDPRVPLFRVLRRVWAVDETGRPLIAMLSALARDPLLRATTDSVLDLTPGAELMRASLLDTLRDAVGERLNDAVLDKVARNVASSWNQSGHLHGRVRKIRQQVTPTRGSTALALWLGSMEGLAGEGLLDSRWTRVLDRSGSELLPAALEAKKLGLVHVRAGGRVVEIDATRLDQPAARG